MSDNKGDKELLSQSKIFNISSYARNKVETKRRNKGLGELIPRENNPYKQFLTYSTSICFAKTLFAPLERLRLISQVRHMPNIPTAERASGSSFSNLAKIVGEQGPLALWRGNNVDIYRHFAVIGLQVTVYDRIKHAYMPYDSSRYSGIDYYWRLIASAGMIMGITAGITYPLDLIHTRLASDMSKKGQQRLYTTTFDCFNRTNIDEGFKKGLYKGIELSVASSAIRAGLVYPLYDLLQRE